MALLRCPAKDHRIYLDNAATSYPKPVEVVKAMTHFLSEIGANPGRSGHRCSVEAARVIYAAREAVAALFNAPDPLRVVFTANVTESLNLALYGLLRPGDHVITSSMEHNSVMRPLRALEQQGVLVSVAACSAQGQLDPLQVERAICPQTRLIVLNHASNVCGGLLPVAEVGALARQRGVLLLTDEAQTAGAYPVDMQAAQIDLLAFTGHKSLYGPMGTGGLIIGERVDLEQLKPLKQGGTGSRSEQEVQPAFLPDRYESGTPNAVGLAGLCAGIHWVLRQGVERLRTLEESLCQELLDGLAAIPGITLYGGLSAASRTATIAFNLQGMQPSEVGLRLDEEYGILCRVGLHCAPAAHRTLGSFPGGSVRLSLGAATSRRQVQAAIKALTRLASEGRAR